MQYQRLKDASSSRCSAVRQLCGRNGRAPEDASLLPCRKATIGRASSGNREVESCDLGAT